MKTATVATTKYGEIKVYKLRDLADNIKLGAVDGVSLPQWRENPNLIPPILLPGDLVGGFDAYAAVLDSLEISRDHYAALGLDQADDEEEAAREVEELYPEDCQLDKRPCMILVNEGDQTIYEGSAADLPGDADSALKEAVASVVAGSEEACGRDAEGCEFTVTRLDD